MSCRGIKTTLLIGLCLILAACSREYRSVYWIKHPQMLRTKIERCSKMPIPQARANATCMQAASAYQHLATLGPELASNPEHFGQKIINAQIRLANLKAQLSKANLANKSTLKTQVEAQKEWVAILQAVTVAMGEG